MHSNDYFRFLALTPDNRQPLETACVPESSGNRHKHSDMKWQTPSYNLYDRENYFSSRLDVGFSDEFFYIKR